METEVGQGCLSLSGSSNPCRQQDMAKSNADDLLLLLLPEKLLVEATIASLSTIVATLWP